MPANQITHMITETDAIRECLNKAAIIWPTLAKERSALLEKVLEEGMAVVNSKAKATSKKKTPAIDDLAKTMSGVWPEDWLEKRKLEWPQ